jgi:hypothetical protein
MWRIRDVYPGSDFFPSRILTVFIPDPGSSSKNFSILTPKKAKKWFLSSKKYDPSCSSRIRMLTFSHPGSRGQKDTQSRIPDPDTQHWFQLHFFPQIKFLSCLFFRSFSIVKPPVTEGEGEEGKELDMVREEEEEETPSAVNTTKPALVKYTDIRQAETRPRERKYKGLIFALF